MPGGCRFTWGNPPGSSREVNQENLSVLEPKIWFLMGTMKNLFFLSEP